jgi:hypothetical protein
MPGERTVKNVFQITPQGKRSVGNPRKRWLDDVENDLQKMGSWRKITKDTDAWKFVLNETRVLLEP